MENQNGSRSLQKFEINGTGEPTVDVNELSLRSKNKKSLGVHKLQQPDIAVEISPYATSYPLANRLYALKNPRKYQTGMVSDRVMSAKLIKMKELESELNVLRKQLNEVNAENKLLRAVQHRQDHALKKFEGTKGQLPQLIQSHSEEVRALKAKYKKISMQNRDLEKRLRNREVELRSIQEQNRHMQQLAKDRSLGERERLREEVDSLKSMLQHMEFQLQEISRKKAVEQRVHQQRLQQEMSLSKELKKSLLSAEQNIQELKALLLENDITFETEKMTSKSPKEVKKSGARPQRLPLLAQQHQTEAVDVFKDSNQSSMKKLFSGRPKPCSSLVMKNKTEMQPKSSHTSNERRMNQLDGSSGDDGETESLYQRVSFKNAEFGSKDTFHTSDDFYLSLQANAYTEGGDNGELRENVTRSPKKADHEGSLRRQPNILREDVSNSHSVSELRTSDGSVDESDAEDSIPPKTENKSLKREMLPSDTTDITQSCDAESEARGDLKKFELEDKKANQGEMDRSKKDKLLKALKDIDHEEWTDIDTSEEVETERRNTQVRAVQPKKMPTGFGKGKVMSDRSCSSGPSSAKSKNPSRLRNSAKADLMHELFGTIPRSEFQLHKKKYSDPSVAMYRDIKS